MMNNLLNIVEDEQTSEFYPTPKELVEKMLDGVDFRMIETVLEPSAGKGDILRVLASKENYSNGNFEIDCIEYDANLRQILKYNFGERKSTLDAERDKIMSKYRYCREMYDGSWRYNKANGEYEDVPSHDNNKLKELTKEMQDAFFDKGIHIVHDDFLTYRPFKKYDLIIMNPPFSNGDKHLLKALKMQENGGNIICLLNAETLKNPYTETRRELLEQLNKYNAMIEYIDNAFVSAERKTAVEVALIKVAIEQKQEESDIFNRMQEAEKVEEFDNFESTELEVTDIIKQTVNRFNVEVRSGLELIRQYKALMPYLKGSFDKDSYNYKASTLVLQNANNSRSGLSVNEFLEDTRLKYWKALLSNPKFTGKLTSTLQKEYYEKVNSLAKYDYTEFNIYTLVAEMNTQVKSGIESEIIVMFDRLTEEHSYYPECQKNRHYYDGWKTNKAHKIDKKVIIPSYGVFDSWDGKPRSYNAWNIVNDIERILNFLDGHMTQNVDSKGFLESYFNQGITKNIPMKFFKATFYKKGTVHLTFTCPELIERFNIYAAQHKAWLPPCYGKKTYKDMTADEKTVIDSFQGEKAYNDIMAKSDYYLAPVTNNQLLGLGSGVSE